MNPQVSVIVPVYGVEQYLDRCVQSLLAQSLKDIEIILVDDGSPDNCPAMCDEYARTHHNIKVVHKENAGLGMACNSGIDIANGEFIAFVDSDDWVDQKMYETMYYEAITSQADVVFTGLKRVDHVGIVSEMMRHPQDRVVINAQQRDILICDLISTSPEKRFDHDIQVSAKVVLYRRAVIQKSRLRFKSERIYPSEDLIFNIEVVSHANTVVILPKYFYNYFYNSNSITTTLKQNHYKKVLKTAILLNNITDIHIQSEIILRIGRFLIAEARSYCRQIIKSQVSKEQKMQMFREVCADIKDSEYLHKYPILKMPFKHLIMYLSIRYNLYKLANFIYRIN